MNAIKETVSALSAVVIVLGAFSTLVPAYAFPSFITIILSALIIVDSL